MNVPTFWPLLALAAGAVGLALWAGAQQPIAIAFGVVGLVVAGFLLREPYRRAARAPPPRPDWMRPDLGNSFAGALRAGRNGRSEAVGILDELERHAGRPDLPITPGVELGRIRNLPRAEFEEYVQDRVAAIERGLM